MRLLLSFFTTCITFVLLINILYQHGSPYIDSNPALSTDISNIVTRGEQTYLYYKHFAHISKRTRNISVSRHLPDAIIIGGRKCGTRALLEFLRLHPQVRAARYEMHFFDNDTAFDSGLNWYKAQMPLARPGDIVVEKTPSYFVRHNVPARVIRVVPNVKLILILRHPVTRTISDYTQVKSVKNSKGKNYRPLSHLAFNKDGTVNSEYKPIKNSLYHAHLSNWLKVFPMTSFHIVDGDNFIRRPLMELHLLETYLNLKPLISSKQIYYNSSKGFYCLRRVSEDPGHCLGDGKGRAHVLVSDGVKHKLQKFFEPHNLKLFGILNKTFSWS